MSKSLGTNFALIIVLGLASACGNPNRLTPAQDQAIQASAAQTLQETQDRIKGFEEAQQRKREKITKAEVAVNTFSSDPTPGCETLAFWNAKLALQAIQSDLYAAQPQLELDFMYADAALRKRCFDIAEQQYRQVIEVFVGGAYAAYRERALLGIQDVKEARNKKPQK